MPRSLFRKEAIDAQREKFLGEASIAQPVRLWVYTSFAVAVAVLVIAVAVWGQYTRRERVQGVLTSVQGAAVVRTPDAGTIAEIAVKEGDPVARGALIAKLTVDRAGANAESGNAAVVRELETRRALLDTELQQTADLGRQQVERLKKQVADYRAQVADLDRAVQAQTGRWESQRVIADKWSTTRSEAQSFVSEIRVRQEQDKVTEESLKVQELQRQRSRVAQELTVAQSNIATSELQTRTQLDQINQKISAANQDIAAQVVRREQEVRRDMMINAPIDGIVTNIAPSRGQTVAPDAQVATILPRDTEMQAELLVPTRAIGFVHPGQQVNLRYEAFPYERYGQYRGSVVSVGKTILMQGDNLGAVAIREPGYRIVVRLDRQSIVDGPEERALRVGMVVGADLLMEKRSLLEWLFQPVLQLRERMRTAQGGAS